MNSLYYHAKHQSFKTIDEFLNTYKYPRVLVLLQEMKKESQINYKILNFYELNKESKEDILNYFSINQQVTHYFLNNFTNDAEKQQFIDEIQEIITSKNSIII